MFAEAAILRLYGSGRLHRRARSADTIPWDAVQETAERRRKLTQINARGRGPVKRRAKGAQRGGLGEENGADLWVRECFPSRSTDSLTTRTFSALRPASLWLPLPLGPHAGVGRSRAFLKLGAEPL